MKTKMLLILFALAGIMVNAQDDMPEMWSTKVGHNIDFYGCNNEDDDGLGYVSDGKELSVYENSKGDVLWTKKMKDIAPRLRKVDDMFAIWDAQKIFLLDLKLGKEQVSVVDMNTGEALWFSDEYKLRSNEMVTYIKEEDGFLFTFKDKNVFVDAKTGAQKWSTSKFKGKIGAYYYENGFLTTVNFIPSEFLALFTGFKNQIAKINMKTGEIVWENTYIGRAERKIVSREFMFSIEVVDNHVILQLAGLQVYDYKTGATLWSAAYSHDAPVKRPRNAKSFGVYGDVADPVFTDNHVYVIDMSGKKNQYIRKYERKTGKMVWQSQEIAGGARAIPNMFVVDGKIILQIGGVVEIQGVFEEKEGQGLEATSYYVKRIYDENIKPNGVQAFSDEDGRLIWDSERFKKGITNMFIHGGDELIVCSGKALYNMDIHTGDVKYEEEVKNGGVGNAVSILPFEDMIVVVGEKGVSTFNIADGKLIAANKYKRASIADYFNNILVLETPKNDIAAFDVADNCKFWSYNARKGAGSTLTTDGEHVYVYEKKTITRLHTKPKS